MLKIVPKIGPFRALAFKIPTQKTEDLYIASVNHTVDSYRGLLVEVGNKDLALTNTDFDTGRDTQAGEYPLTDKAYAYLLDKLAAHNFDNLTPDLRKNILAFYSNPAAPLATKKDAGAWQKTQDELQRLKNLSPDQVPPTKATSTLEQITEPDLSGDTQPASVKEQDEQ